MDNNNMNNGQSGNTGYNQNGYDPNANTGYNQNGYDANTNYQQNGYNAGTGYPQTGYDPNAGYNTTYDPTYNTTYNTGYTTYQQQNGNQPIIKEISKAKGLLGAVIGALLGGAIWVIIGCLGFVSGWVAIAIFLLAQFGYKKMNKGEIDTFGVIISVILGLVTILPATWCVCAVQAYKVLSENAPGHFSFFEVLGDLPLYMDRYDWWKTFYSNLAMGYLFTGIAAIYVGVGTLSSKASEKRAAKRAAKKAAKDAQNGKWQ